MKRMDNGMADIRLIAMDMDGTLLDGHNGIAPDNLKALNKAQEKGITIAIASGRFPENVAMIVMDYGFSCPIIGINGAEIVASPMGRLLFSHRMDREAALKTRQMLDSFDADYFSFSPKLVATSKVGSYHHSELSYGERIQRAGGVRYEHGPEGITHALSVGISKYYVSDTGNLSQIREALCTIPGILVTKSGEDNIEIMPAGVDKGRGVRELAGSLQIPLENVMTFGDQDNDLPMLTCVGYGVAMGNAPDVVKEKTRYVTARYDECGVARAIERYAL